VGMHFWVTFMGNYQLNFQASSNKFFSRVFFLHRKKPICSSWINGWALACNVLLIAHSAERGLLVMLAGYQKIPSLKVTS
jgi:hypothetical protein